MNKSEFAKVAGVSPQTLLSHIRILQTIIIEPQTDSHKHKTKTEIYLNRV